MGARDGDDPNGGEKGGKLEVEMAGPVLGNESSIEKNTVAPLQHNEDAHLTLKQSLIKWRRVVIYSLCMTSAILMYGYDYVIIGTISAMPSFQ